MNKKEYILYLLDDLKGIWELANSLFLVIEKIDNSNPLLDSLFIFLKENIENTNNKNINEIFIKNKNKLKEYLDSEKNDNNIELKELEKIEKELDILF